ncbi:MAG: MCP four helix bundle domain-containing protein, partial [Gemmatimonadetes bacterium]|nr:MCP four helix bundle domain-containing protein [Gemmatimonadota bacterium]
MRLTIGRKLLGLSALGVLLVVAVGTVSYRGLNTVDTANGTVVNDLTALRSHGDVDMMHDAIRADVLAALVASEGGGVGRAATLDKLTEHVTTLTQSLAAEEKSSTDAEVQQAIVRVRPPLDAYVRSAREISELAFTDRAAAQGRIPAFMESFGALETELGALSTLIENRADAARTAGAGASQGASRIIIAITVLAFALLAIV